MNFSPETLQIISNKILTMGLEFTPKLASALAVLIIGWIIIKMLIRGLSRIFDKTNFDEALEGFILSLASVGLKIILIVTVAAMLGVQTTSLAALLGAAGLAVGLALQGSLSNFAGGVLILVFKPFKIGDYIEAQGHGGTVESIQIFNTILKTGQRKRIILPNGKLSNDSVVNWTAKKKVRVDMTFGIGYNDDIDKTRKILQKLVDDETVILDIPATQIFIGNLGDSSVDMLIRAWTKPDDSWTLPFIMNEKVKKAFDKAGISIPFPQRDIHLYNEKK